MASDIGTFSGEEAFSAEPQRLFEALIDPAILAKSIPDLVSSERVDDRTLRCIVKPGFSFMRATMKMTISIADVNASARTATMHISSSGIGASMKVRCHLKAEPAAQVGSIVKWQATVDELGGLLRAVSPALIRGAADKVIRDGWNAVRQHVETAN